MLVKFGIYIALFQKIVTHKINIQPKRQSNQKKKKYSMSIVYSDIKILKKIIRKNNIK